MAIPFMRIFIVPAVKRAGNDLLEFAVPDFLDVVSGRKNVKTAAKSVGHKLWDTIWVVVAGKRVQAESFHENLQNKAVGREQTFF